MIKLKDTPHHMIANNLTPFEPSHPGELLKDELAARGITQRAFAAGIGISPTVLNEVLNCRRPVSIELAMLVEASLGLNPEIFINMQTRYNMLTVRRNRTFAERLAQIRKACATL
jgi:addiction module antidote protein HigA